MPITINRIVNLTPVERAAINEIKAEGQTAEEYVEANDTKPGQLQEITHNFVRSRMEGRFTSIGEGIVAAEFEAPEKLPEIEPHVRAIETILGLPEGGAAQ